MTEVLYARVAGPLKQALQAHAGERGLSQTAAAVELLERGLEQSVRSNELEQTQARLRQAELELHTAQQREQATAHTYQAVAERARQQLALCLHCRQPLRGDHFLVSGHCPNCNRALSALLLPTPKTGAPDRDAYLALLGAIGVLVGLATASSPDSTDRPTSPAPAPKTPTGQTPPERPHHKHSPVSLRPAPDLTH
jgi:hypothetical protein